MLRVVSYAPMTLRVPCGMESFRLRRTAENGMSEGLSFRVGA
jgi:hypothetical protein